MNAFLWGWLVGCVQTLGVTFTVVVVAVRMLRCRECPVERETGYGDG